MRSSDAGEPLLDDPQRQFRPVALAAQVAEVEMPKVGRHDLLGRIRRGIVREVSMPAQDSLLEAPRPARAILQHFDIVVGFQHQGVGGPDSIQHQTIDVPKIGEKPKITRRRAQEKPNRILRVVRDGKCLDRDVPNLETGAGRENAARQAALELVLDSLVRRSVAIHRDV